MKNPGPSQRKRDYRWTAEREEEGEEELREDETTENPPDESQPDKIVADEMDRPGDHQLEGDL